MNTDTPQKWKIWIPIIGLFYMKAYIFWWVQRNWGRPDYWELSPINLWLYAPYHAFAIVVTTFSLVKLLVP